MSTVERQAIRFIVATLCNQFQHRPSEGGINKRSAETSAGTIVLELNDEKAPKTVANFLQYVESDHYAGTVFHRVIKGRMIQGGGMTPDLKEKPIKTPVVNEGGNGLSNKKYTIAMVSTPNPDKRTSQFFINSNDNLFLDREKSQDGFGYAVFGTVVEGKDVVDKIEGTKTGVKTSSWGIPMRDVPEEPIVIKKAAVLK